MGEHELVVGIDWASRRFRDVSSREDCDIACEIEQLAVILSGLKQPQNSVYFIASSVSTRA
jgi:hypothetical protein